MSSAPIKTQIAFEDFEKPDIWIGKIDAVSDVENSDKLIKLSVDFGDHRRSILAGIKRERQNPREIEGKQALFVVSLPGRNMVGEVSQRMLFDIGYADELNPCLAMLESPMLNVTRTG